MLKRYSVFLVSLLFVSLIIGFFSIKSTLIKAAGNVYYVATTGSDSNSGTQSSPWKTIQKAANSVSAGDTVYVAAGSYGESVSITKSGSSSTSMITFIGSGETKLKTFSVSGSYVAIKGFTLAATDCSWSGTIDISGDNCLIDSNTIKDSTRQGIQVNYGADSNTLKGNIIARVHVNGIMVVGSNNVIDSNDISDVRDNINGCSINTEANGIEFHGSGNTFVGNYIHDFFKANQKNKPHIDAFQTQSDATNKKYAGKDTVIERNRVFFGDTSTNTLEEAWDGSNTIYGFMFGASSSDKATNITIKNNLIQSWGGFNVGGTGSGNMSGIKFYNNTFRSGSSFNASYWPRGINFDGISSYEMYNNIFVDFSYAHIMVSNGSTGSAGNNIFWNSNGTQPAFYSYTKTSTDKVVNPGFISNFSDLHLASTSPAINAGYTLSTVKNDLDGNSRPQGSTYDIGTYESSGTSTATTSPTTAPTVKLGDGNSDGNVDETDYAIWLSGLGKTTTSGPSVGDFNSSGKVDGIDYVIWLNNYGK